MRLKSPFPWFGGKSLAAGLIWQALGDVPNYVEPFAGSLASVLLRPGYDPLLHTETVNDLDCYVANFWRALQHDPEGVCKYCDQPVNEADLHARHQWLISQSGFREQMLSDADFYDVKVAGWWVWGLCCWIGSGWCHLDRGAALKLPHLGSHGRGVHRKRPHVGDHGRGVHRKRPHLGNHGQGDLPEYLNALADRLRRVRVCCGDWSRVLGPSPTYKLGLTGVLLDPPYRQDLRADLYSVETHVSDAVREWAIENGNNSLLRIVLCGYEGEHEMPDDWRKIRWKSGKGYAGQNTKAENNNRDLETLWLSPGCLSVDGEVYIDGRETKAKKQLNIWDALLV